MLGLPEGVGMSAPRVLIVEDDDALREALREVFSFPDWEVHSARTATYAFWLLNAPFQYVVAELDLPDGMGESLLEAVRATRTRTFVVVVVKDEDDLRRASIQERFQPAAIVRMPIDVAGLRALCEAHRRGAGA
jgi:DNA-binding NtrC family response regulator